MSDLPPFVAAVLRDQTVADLMRELKEQKERVGKMQEIDIRAGERVCFKGKMDQGKYAKIGEFWWVSVEQVADLPLAEIGSLEILLGGTVVASSTHQTRSGQSRRDGPYHFAMDAHSSVRYFSFRIGPFASFQRHRPPGVGHGAPCARLAQEERTQK